MSIQDYVQKNCNPRIKETIAYGFIITSAIFWVLGFIYSNENNLGGSETCLSRYTVSVVTSYIYARSIGSQWNLNHKEGFMKLMFRSIIFVVHSFVSSVVQFYIPINLFHVLGFTGPIFTFLTNYLVYGVKATRVQVIGVGLTFLGLILTINGRLLYSLISQDYEFQSSFTNYKTDSIYIQIMVCLLYLGWMFIWSLALIFTKIQEFNSAQMLFSAAAMGSAIYGFFFNFYSDHAHAGVYYESLLWVGLPLTVSSYAFTFGFKLASNAGKASTLLLVVNVVVGYGVSFFRYGEGLNVFVVVGTVVISGAVLAVLISKGQEGNTVAQNGNQEDLLAEKTPEIKINQK